VPLRPTWLVVLLALFTVAGAGGMIGAKFARHVMVDCSGRLELVPLADVPSSLAPKALGPSDIEVRYDTKEAAFVSHQNVRVAWSRTGGIPACADVPIPWTTPHDPPTRLVIRHDAASGIYEVYDPAYESQAIYVRKVDERGHRFMRDRVFVRTNLSVLVFLF
jgi:hypothetical protein